MSFTILIILTHLFDTHKYFMENAEVHETDIVLTPANDLANFWVHRSTFLNFNWYKMSKLTLDFFVLLSPVTTTVKELDSVQCVSKHTITEPLFSLIAITPPCPVIQTNQFFIFRWWIRHTLFIRFLLSQSHTITMLSSFLPLSVWFCFVKIVFFFITCSTFIKLYWST